MFSQASVIQSVHSGGRCYDVTSCSVMVITSPLTAHPPGQHTPPVNKRAVRILLECFLVLNISGCSFPRLI